MKEISILKVLVGSHAIEILEGISKSPLRFTDIEHICPSRKTRCIRLRELEQKNLINVVPKLIAHRSYTYYEITNKGIQSLELLEKLLSLDMNPPNKSLTVTR